MHAKIHLVCHRAAGLASNSRGNLVLGILRFDGGLHGIFHGDQHIAGHLVHATDRLVTAVA